ncbi:hypothetical protein VPH35_139600 [Triticum aestivum]
MSRVAIKHGRRCDGSAALRWSTSCRYRGCSEAWPELRWSTLCQCRGCNEEWPELRRVAGAALEHPHAGVAAAMEHGRSYGGTSALRCSTAAPVLAAAMKHGRSCAGSPALRWSTACRCRGCNEAWTDLRRDVGAAL